MAYLQLLKPTPSNSQWKFRDFCSQLNLKASVKRRIRLTNTKNINGYRSFRVYCKIEDGGSKQSNGEEPPESLFMKELRRRGMTPTSLLEEKIRSPDREEEIMFREEDGGWKYSRRNDVTTDAETNLSNQRETSMALNSEGLEVGKFQFLLIIISYLFPLKCIVSTDLGHLICLRPLPLSAHKGHSGTPNWAPP
ncbi:hypothetical protein ACS0TY_002820 [Phlomoides rotata]